jgi:DNA polymerase-3 subunit alpha
MAVFTLEDAAGGVEVIAFPETYQRSASLIETGTMLLVRGKLERDEESVRILAAEILPIDNVRERLAREVAIRVTGSNGGLAAAVRDILARHRGDRRVLFEVETGALRVRLDVSAQIRVNPTRALIAELEQVVGAGAVSLR